MNNQNNIPGPVNSSSDGGNSQQSQDQQPRYAPPSESPQPAQPAPVYQQAPQPAGAPQYQQIPNQQTYNNQQSTNVLAILSLVFAFVFPIAGIILGHMSLSQIKKTAEGGRGLAVTGLILSYVFTLIGLLFTFFYIVMFFSMMRW